MLWFIAVQPSAHEILAIKISKKILTQQKILKNSSTWNIHTTETVSHNIINNINFWKCVTRPFRWIYVNCFNRLRFLAEISKKLQKMPIFDNLMTINQEGSMKTRQMTPFFSSTFSNLFVIFISEFENAQNSFSCGPPPLVHSGLRNTSIFGQQLPIQTAHHTFLESRHPEVTKNLYYVLFSGWSQIPIFLGSSSWTIYFIPKNRYSLCTALFLTPTTNRIKSSKMETESKSASEHSKSLFFCKY